MLEVREPDDARAAVARPLVVRRLELLEAEHPLAARGQARGRRAAHAAKADDDDVKRWHRPRVPSGTPRGHAQGAAHLLHLRLAQRPDKADQPLLLHGLDMIEIDG